MYNKKNPKKDTPVDVVQGTRKEKLFTLRHFTSSKTITSIFMKDVGDAEKLLRDMGSVMQYAGDSQDICKYLNRVLNRYCLVSITGFSDGVILEEERGEESEQPKD